MNWWTLVGFGLSPAELARRILQGPLQGSSPWASLSRRRISWNESSVCTLLYYRKLIPIVSDENTDRWGGLGGTAPTARSRPVIVSHPRFEPGYPEILDHRWTCTIFLVRDLRDIVISEGGRPPDFKDKLKLPIAGVPAQAVPSIGQRLETLFDEVIGDRAVMFGYPQQG